MPIDYRQMKTLRERMIEGRNAAGERWGERERWDESPGGFVEWTHDQYCETLAAQLKAEVEVERLQAAIDLSCDCHISELLHGENYYCDVHLALRKGALDAE